MEQQRKTIAQRRADHAWRAIKFAEEKLGDDDKIDYGRQVKRMPIGIMTSGLGHTIAFMHASSKKIKVRELITDQLAEWLLKERGFKKNFPNPKGRDVEGVIRTENSDFLRLITEESLLYLHWLTRFADAEFKTNEGDLK